MRTLKQQLSSKDSVLSDEGVDELVRTLKQQLSMQPAGRDSVLSDGGVDELVRTLKQQLSSKDSVLSDAGVDELVRTLKQQLSMPEPSMPADATPRRRSSSSVPDLVLALQQQLSSRHSSSVLPTLTPHNSLASQSVRAEELLQQLCSLLPECPPAPASSMRHGTTMAEELKELLAQVCPRVLFLL